jgi:predicted nucleotidyltransferase
MPAGPPPSPSDVESRLASFFAAASPSGVVSAYLFGSHAAGRAHRESDVDVGVLLDWSVHPSPAGGSTCA